MELDPIPFSTRPKNYFIFKVVLGLLFLLSMIADIYLIVIISKFKSIQTHANLLFRSVAWCHLCYMFMGTVGFILITLFSFGVNPVGFILLQNIDYICLGLIYFLLTFIAVDWAVSQYCPNYYDNHPKIFKRGVLISFLFLLPEILVTTFACVTVDPEALDFLRLLCKTVSFFACFAVLLGLFITRRCKPPPTDDPKAEYRLTVPCVFLLMVLPATIDACILLSYNKHYVDIVFDGDYSISSDITNTIFVLAPVVMVILLRRTSKYFQMAYIRCCKKKSVEGYTDDNLDDEQPVDPEQGPPVTFQKNFEAVHI